MAEVTEQGFVLLCRPPLPLSPHQRVPPTLCQVSQLSRLPAKRGRPPRHTERTLEDCLNALFPPRAVPSLGAKRLRPSEDRMRSRHWSPNPGDGDLLVLYGKGEAAGPAMWMLLPAPGALVGAIRKPTQQQCSLSSQRAATRPTPAQDGCARHTVADLRHLK